MLTREEKTAFINAVGKMLREADETSKVKSIGYMECGHFNRYPAVDIEYDDGSVKICPINDVSRGNILKSIANAIYK